MLLLRGRGGRQTATDGGGRSSRGGGRGGGRERAVDGGAAAGEEAGIERPQRLVAGAVGGRRRVEPRPRLELSRVLQKPL